MKILFLLACLFLWSTIFAQDSSLYLPAEMKSAIEKGSRTHNGIPGENYFANTIDYDIRAEFDPQTSMLRGSEKVYYTNNSSDSLRTVVINLYQNILKKGNARDWDVEADQSDLHEGVVLSDIRFNGQAIGIQSPRVNYNRSVIQLQLPEAIPPGSKSVFDISWSFRFPETMQVRYGKFGEGNYLVAYWYPKIAVYDDIYGWDVFAYTGNQEFYNDMGDYDVEITVPGDYNLWASGQLQNAREIYQPEYLARIEKAAGSDEVVEIITKEDREEGLINIPREKHVWKFNGEGLPDFIFAMSKYYLWNATSVESGDRRILISNLYDPQHAEAAESYASVAAEAIRFFTHEIPAIPYPYSQVSVFQSTGMEYPGIAGSVVTPQQIVNMNAVIHEVGHAYFPFQTGFNEEKYGWMDEGLITFYPQLLVQQEMGVPLFNYSIMAYNQLGGSIYDLPLMTPTLTISEWDAYTFHAYYRSSVAFHELYQLLGKDKFVRGLQMLYHNWSGKHPTPWDMFRCFEEVTGSNLSWFWDPWFFRMAFADLGIGKVTQQNGEARIRVYNEGGLPLRIKLQVKYTDGSEEQKIFPASVWKDRAAFYDINLETDKEIASVQLGAPDIPDTRPDNNTGMKK